MRLFASVAVLSFALATSVSAKPGPDQPPAQPAATETTAPAPASDKAADKKKDGVICRREIPTGSHFPVKVCTTAEQRKAERSQTQRAQETLQRPSEVVPQ